MIGSMQTAISQLQLGSKGTCLFRPCHKGLSHLTILPHTWPHLTQQLGGKGANLAEMSRIGLSVPPGLTITTSTCAEFHDNGGHWGRGARGVACAAVDAGLLRARLWMWMMDTGELVGLPWGMWVPQGAGAGRRKAECVCVQSPTRMVGQVIMQALSRSWACNCSALDCASMSNAAMCHKPPCTRL